MPVLLSTLGLVDNRLLILKIRAFETRGGGLQNDFCINYRCREIFLQQTPWVNRPGLTAVIRQRQHAAAAAASSTGSSGSSGRGWRAARAAAAGSAAAVQAAAHVVCGSCGGSGGCGGTRGAGCRCRMPRRVLGHAAAAVIAPTAPACGGGLCGRNNSV